MMDQWNVKQYSGVAYRYYINGDEQLDPETYRFSDLPWDQELVRIQRYQSA